MKGYDKNPLEEKKHTKRIRLKLVERGTFIHQRYGFPARSPSFDRLFAVLPWKPKQNSAPLTET